MHLVAPLAGGIAAAANGTVDMYRRGTSTRATYYTDFEASSAVTPTGAISLGSYGEAVLYVNEVVDCIVRDASGAAVRTFTAGVGAPAVEVISQSFTGTDYETAQSGASKPVALSTALDALFTSFGARDFKVLFNGASTTMQTAIAGVGSLFFNVKSPAYGAVGDGSTNDTSAIQAACDAASAAGGGTVFFPPGTYKTTTAITVAAGVSLLGAGPGASIVAIAHATANVFTLAASTTYFSSITGLRIGASQSNTGNHIQAHSGNKLRIDNCFIGNSFMNGNCVSYDTAGSVIYVLNSTFQFGTSGGTSAAINCNTSAVEAACHVFGCTVTFSGLYQSTMFNLGSGSVIATKIDGTSKTGSGTCFKFLATSATGLLGAGLVLGCWGTEPSSGTVIAFGNQVGASAVGDGFTEIGNRFSASYSYGVGAGGGPGGVAAKLTYFGQHMLHRDRGRSYTQDDTAAVSVTPNVYSLAEVERTTTGNQTCSFEGIVNSGPVNEDFILVYNNLAQASPTGTITVTGSVKGLTTFTVNANRWSAYFFKSVHYGTSTAWALVNSVVNQT
jgi:hypothetical protein